MSEMSAEGIVSVRKQGLGEEIANAISHGMGAVLAIVGTVLLLVRAVSHGSHITVVSAALYGGSMILLYSISCLYHALTLPQGKHVFQVLDHCSIFLLILGTYIPIALVGIGGAFGWAVFGVIAFCAGGYSQCGGSPSLQTVFSGAVCGYGLAGGLYHPAYLCHCFHGRNSAAAVGRCGLHSGRLVLPEEGILLHALCLASLRVDRQCPTFYNDLSVFFLNILIWVIWGVPYWALARA